MSPLFDHSSSSQICLYLCTLVQPHASLDCVAHILMGIRPSTGWDHTFEEK